MRQYHIHFLFIQLIITQLCFGQKGIDDINRERDAYIQAFLEDEHAPLNKKGIKKLRFYPPDTNYIVTGTFEFLSDTTIFTMPTSSGKTKQYVKYGKVSFQLGETTCVLSVYQSIALREKEAYKDYLFIPFNDATNGLDTYGGGRYLDLRFSDINHNQQTLTIDFNSCYNPYCAYSDGYSCPVPPAENLLPIAVEAGEKAYAGKRH